MANTRQKSNQMKRNQFNPVEKTAGVRDFQFAMATVATQVTVASGSLGMLALILLFSSQICATCGFGLGVGDWGCVTACGLQAQVAFYSFLLSEWCSNHRTGALRCSQWGIESVSEVGACASVVVGSAEQEARIAPPLQDSSFSNMSIHSGDKQTIRQSDFITQTAKSASAKPGLTSAGKEDVSVKPQHF